MKSQAVEPDFLYETENCFAFYKNKLTTGIVIRLKIVVRIIPCEIVSVSTFNCLDSISGMFAAGTASISAMVLRIRVLWINGRISMIQPMGTRI